MAENKPKLIPASAVPETWASLRTQTVPFRPMAASHLRQVEELPELTPATEKWLDARIEAFPKRSPESSE